MTLSTEKEIVIAICIFFWLQMKFMGILCFIPRVFTHSGNSAEIALVSRQWEISASSPNVKTFVKTFQTATEVGLDGAQYSFFWNVLHAWWTAKDEVTLYQKFHQVMDILCTKQSSNKKKNLAKDFFKECELEW